MSRSCSSCTIHIQNLNLTRGNKNLFSNFNLSASGGTISAILGPSGCGKTSLLHIIASLLKGQSGSVEVSCSADKHSISQIKPAYLFQEPRLLPWHTIERNISLILEGRLMLDGSSIYDAKSARETALDYLTKVGLEKYALRYPSQLSGGERQRVSLARAFAFPSPVLLMDEAFQSQDIHLKLQLMDLLYMLHNENPRTVIMVTHDIRESLSLAERVIVLSGTPISILIDSPVPVKEVPSKTYIRFPKVLHELECNILRVMASIDECPVFPV